MSIYDFAKDIILNTDTTLFVTGRAGTGKTTLLRYVAESSQKNTVVVAPTGIAAINAGGVTIHSFFKLPFAPFIPSVIEAKKLIAGQKMRAEFRSVIRSVDMIIIDEVSMLRADILDAIDVVLRHYRNSKFPFGGVQMVFFGDMYQLPPVCVNDEWFILKDYYTTPYFFSAKVFEKQEIVCLELDKIFRQRDADFVEILNQVRNNNISKENFNRLNDRYTPDFDLENNQDFVVLTTHNAVSDDINESRLIDIDSKTFIFDAAIKGDFPEYLFPVEQQIVLKKGARVMFTANDHINPERLYYNGKMGTVVELEDNNVYVTCDGEDDPIQVNYETWENNTFSYNRKENSVDVKTIGTFTQLPLRLAWAITIHKSQGLTFQKVAIDAANSFTSGQVYVALSRCTSLDGIVLLSPINRNSIMVDSRIQRFSKNNFNEDLLPDFVNRKKRDTLCNMLIKLFSFNLLEVAVLDLKGYVTEFRADFSDYTPEMVENILSIVQDLSDVGTRFAVQLRKITNANDFSLLNSRVNDAKKYFLQRLETLEKAMDITNVSTKKKERANKFSKFLNEVNKNLQETLFFLKNLDDDISVEQFYMLRHEFVVEKVNYNVYEEEKEDANEQTVDSELIAVIYSKLMAWRNNLAKELDIPSYLIFKKDTIMEMAQKMPDTKDKLLKINGVGKVKAGKYGQQCIDIIKSVTTHTIN